MARTLKDKSVANKDFELRLKYRRQTLEAEMARTLVQMSIGTAAGAVMVTMMVTIMAFTGAFA